MNPEEMLKELYEELTDGGGLGLNEWEESFINDVYEKVYENEWDLTPAQEEKVEQIYDKYIG